MSETTIEWTATPTPDGGLAPGYTFNPWEGCSKVSPGCQHCYAETLLAKRFGRVKWGPTGTRRRTSTQNWAKPRVWNYKASTDGVRYKVFCASVSDVFEKTTTAPLDEWRRDLWRLIEQTPRLDWLLLTKRPENVMQMVPLAWRHKWPRHVWMGTSVEDQPRAALRISELAKIPAPVRFLSCEPLLDALDLTPWFYTPTQDEYGHIYPEPIPLDQRAFHWVIVGGESGPGHRQMDLSWAAKIKETCAEFGVPFFLKQLGGHPDKQGNPETWPAQLRVRQFPRVVTT